MGTIVIGARAQVRRTFGQFNAFIENAGSPREPCVIFTPAHRKGKAFGIGLSKLQDYFDGDSLPTPYAREQLEKAARMMGFEDRHAVKKLMDALYEMVDELVKALPPEMEEPVERKRVVLGEAVLRADGKPIAGHEILQ